MLHILTFRQGMSVLTFDWSQIAYVSCMAKMNNIDIIQLYHLSTFNTMYVQEINKEAYWTLLLQGGPAQIFSLDFSSSTVRGLALSC